MSSLKSNKEGTKKMIIPPLLTHDEDKFKKEYKDALSFLLAARLRYECFTLYCRIHKTDYDKNRLKELLVTPACQEKWFLDLIGEE